MSWFNLGVTKKELEKMDHEFEKLYGKSIKTVNEKQEFEGIMTTPTKEEVLDQDENTTRDTNIDEVIDYSDLED